MLAISRALATSTERTNGATPHKKNLNQFTSIWVLILEFVINYASDAGDPSIHEPPTIVFLAMENSSNS